MRRTLHSRGLRGLVLIAVLTSLSCAGGGIMEDSEAKVYLVVTSYDYGEGPGGSNFYVSVCLGYDVFLANIEITSQPRRPDVTLTNADDVILMRWEVTPFRLDGGTPSPVFVRDFDVHVPSGGTATLTNHPIYGAELYLEPPLSHLFPENGGYDPETGLRHIRQSLRVEFFGQTTGGQDVSVFMVKEFDFACQWNL